MDDEASDAAKAGRQARTEIGSAAASHTYAATARARQRGFANRRVRLESIIRSKPSADPAAACCCCERRIFRASHRHVRRIVCARRRRLFAVEPFADATRAVRWRLMSRQALHSTRQRRNRQRRNARFRGGLRFVTLCFNSLPLVASLRVNLTSWTFQSMRPAGLCGVPHATMLPPNKFACQIILVMPFLPEKTASHACRTNPATRVRNH